MIRYFLGILILLILGFIARTYLPAFPYFGDGRIFLVPLIFLCVAVTVEVGAMLVLAFVCGFLWDCHHTLHPTGGDVNVYSETVDSLKFGHSILLFAISGFVMQGVRPIFRKGGYFVSIVVTGIALAVYLLSEFAILSFVRGSFEFTRGVFQFVVYSILLTIVVSPFVFWFLRYYAKICGHLVREADFGKKHE